MKRVLIILGIFILCASFVTGMVLGLNAMVDSTGEERLAEESEELAQAEQINDIAILVVAQSELLVDLGKQQLAQDKLIKNISTQLANLKIGETNCLIAYRPKDSTHFVIPPIDHIRPTQEELPTEKLFLCGVGMKFHSNLQSFIVNPPKGEGLN